MVCTHIPSVYIIKNTVVILLYNLSVHNINYIICKLNEYNNMQKLVKCRPLLTIVIHDLHEKGYIGKKKSNYLYNTKINFYKRQKAFIYFIVGMFFVKIHIKHVTVNSFLLLYEFLFEF